jgi:hypothetical protein
MNMHRPTSHRPTCRRLSTAAALLGLLSATPLAQAQPASDAAGPRNAPANAAASVHVMHPAAAVTATAKAPAALVIGRQAGGTDTLLDLYVKAFKPPRRGGVEMVVTLEENKDGGRQVNVGTFTMFPSKKFEARKPEDERGFRFNAAKALADLGADGAANVKVKVRLAPLHEGLSAHGARLTLGKVQFVPREEPEDEQKDEPKRPK